MYNMEWNCEMAMDFYAPGLKGPSGHEVIGSSVPLSKRLSACFSVGLSVIPSRLQTKSKNKSLGEDTVIKRGLLVHLRVPHTALTSHAPDHCL